MPTHTIHLFFILFAFRARAHAFIGDSGVCGLLGARQPQIHAVVVGGREAAARRAGRAGGCGGVSGERGLKPLPLRRPSDSPQLSTGVGCAVRSPLPRSTIQTLGRNMPASEQKSGTMTEAPDRP
eukprot:Opistho-2@59598